MEVIGNPDRVFPVFVAVWAILMVASMYLFYFSRDVARKRRLFKPFAVGTGVLFLGFVWSMGFPIFVLAGMTPVIVLIIWLNLRMIRFCDACGKTIMQHLPFSSPKYCSNCGAPL